MAYKIISRNMQEHEENLSKVISDAIIKLDKRIVFIDCLNHVSQYIFNKRHLEKIMQNLFLTRIEQIYDLAQVLRDIRINNHFLSSHMLMISSYEHLMHGLDEKEMAYYRKRIQKNISQISKIKKTVVMEVKWAIQSRLNA